VQRSAAATDSRPAWNREELAADPHAHEAKADKVRKMFAAIARSYDLNNRIHSFGRDQAWRRAAVRMAGVRPGDRVLDVACGTGDLTRAFADAGAAAVTGLDFTPEMLEIARRKRLHARTSRGMSGPGATSAKAEVITYVQGDAMALPFPDESFDIVSIAFGIRNVSDPHAALREFRRVLRRGGRLAILEFTRPRCAPVRWLSDVYTNVIMPRTAAIISGDRSGAYRYLPRSIATFMEREEMVGAIESARFRNVRLRLLSFGIAGCYVADAAD